MTVMHTTTLKDTWRFKNWWSSPIKCILHFFLFFIAFETALSANTQTSKSNIHDPHLEEAKGIFQWMADTEGGYVSPKQEMRRLLPEKIENSPLTIYATETIEAGETLVRVPWVNIIDSDDPNDGGQLPCGTIRNVARHMRLGENSPYAPYIRYLMSEDDNQIPSTWSKPAKDLLRQVLDNKENDGLPPDRPSDWIERWAKRCDGNVKDEYAVKAATMIIQRSDDQFMIPAYDAYNHRNGNWTNTDTRTKDGEYHETIATKTIHPGEEIFISYNFCAECGGRKHGYGTAEILRDYGFVERFPQRWHFTEEDYHFDLYEDSDGILQVKWHSKFRPKKENKKEKFRIWLKRQIRRLRRMKNIDWNTEYDEESLGMAKNEWDTIWEFVDANLVAMTMAVESLGPSMATSRNASDSQNEESCPSLLVASANGSHYDDLDFEIDDVEYELYTCDTTDAFEQVGFTTIEKVKSTYQTITFKEKAETNDVCMNLDKIIQICANYRPHYHEYVTHAAARFVKDIRRVIFIGGGDSMLLYEALKYPNLELVVGLELDQMVTRKCFKHFHTQPHFDDERVEWWFGDATKSLLLLPEDYWGSFDLVLVDLSETVMSLSVTDELDVFDALSLLLNPTGVLVKNEVYMEKLSEVFDYTMELYYDSPVICSQCLAFGSNGVDFFHAPTYDHGIDNFLYDDLHSPETHLDFMHDFRKNIAPKEKCSMDLNSAESIKQDKTAGIIEILNAESVEVVLDKSIVLLMTKVALEEGLKVIEDPLFEHGLGVIVMKEGYIAARTWPTLKYIGFDINLWGSTFKIKKIKSALVKAIESSDISSYKVVVGGMYGSSTWKEDQKKIGPKPKKLRNCQEDVVNNGSLDAIDASKVAIEEVVLLAFSDNITAAVVCGRQSQDCPSMDVLNTHPLVNTVIPVYACPELEDGHDIDVLFSCENKVLQDLKQSLGSVPSKLNMLVLDGSALYNMHQIFNSILDSEDVRQELLESHSIAVTWSQDTKLQTWRREFLDRFRKQVLHDPVSRAEIVLQAGGQSFELGVVSTNNVKANYAFEKLENRLKERLAHTGAHIELRKIHGGLFNYIEDFHTKEFKHEDYNHTLGREQFSKQIPLGIQTIFQLSKTESIVKGALELTLPAISDYFEKSLKAINFETSSSRQFFGFGDGCVLLAVSSYCNIILVWDGQEHIDINYFSLAEAIDLSKKFMDAFLAATGRKMQVSLRDDQPRGIGRVVNFPSDIKIEDHLSGQ